MKPPTLHSARRLASSACACLLATTLAATAAPPEPVVTAAATTGMVAELVRMVGGDRVEVIQLMGPGIDPHLYKPTSADASRLRRADVIFYNGLMLEGRMGDLFARLGRGGGKVYALAEAVPADLLLEPEDFGGHHDPHLWFDVALWARCVPVVAEGLAAADPEGAEIYRANAAAAAAGLAELDAWCREVANGIPEEHRILVTSHDAYNYFGRAYGFRVVGLQGVSTVSEASLADMASLVDFIKAQKVPAIFVETSVHPGALRRVAADAGVEIGAELFSDALGAPGEIRDGFDVGTYAGMVRYNMSAIARALNPGT